MPTTVFMLYAYFDLFLHDLRSPISDGDYPCAYYVLWIFPLCALLLCFMIHYDITMGIDFAKNAHCLITISNDIAKDVHCEFTMSHKWHCYVYISLHHNA